LREGELKSFLNVGVLGFLKASRHKQVPKAKQVEMFSATEGKARPKKRVSHRQVQPQKEEQLDLFVAVIQAPLL